MSEVRDQLAQFGAVPDGEEAAVPAVTGRASGRAPETAAARR
jgi:hypothetical protein